MSFKAEETCCVWVEARERVTVVFFLFLLLHYLNPAEFVFPLIANSSKSKAQYSLKREEERRNVTCVAWGGLWVTETLFRWTKKKFNGSFYWAVLKTTFFLTSCSERWFAYQACLQLSAGWLCHSGPVRLMCISLFEGSSDAARALTRNIIIISSRILSTATTVAHCEASGGSCFWNNPPVCYHASQTITLRKAFYFPPPTLTMV